MKKSLIKYKKELIWFYPYYKSLTIFFWKFEGVISKNVWVLFISRWNNVEFQLSDKMAGKVKNSV